MVSLACAVYEKNAHRSEESKWGVRVSENALAPSPSADDMSQVVGITSESQASPTPSPITRDSDPLLAVYQDESETLLDDCSYDTAATFILTPDVGTPPVSHAQGQEVTAPTKNRGTDSETNSASTSMSHGSQLGEGADGLAYAELAHVAATAETRMQDENTIMGGCDLSSIDTIVETTLATMIADTTLAPKPKPKPRPKVPVQIHRRADPVAIATADLALMVEANVPAYDSVEVMGGPAKSAAGRSAAGAQTRPADIQNSLLSASQVADREQPSIFSFFPGTCGTAHWDKVVSTAAHTGGCGFDSSVGRPLRRPVPQMQRCSSVESRGSLCTAWAGFCLPLRTNLKERSTWGSHAER